MVPNLAMQLKYFATQFKLRIKMKVNGPKSGDLIHIQCGVSGMNECVSLDSSDTHCMGIHVKLAMKWVIDSII